ncbi:MAG: 4Fe-4S binding protein, partial [Firmicutes bacterium]|nr:4Fe-4S binding protein [Bacillota bacterium]
MLRKIIRIDEEKCNGCGACAAACHEGVIAMVDGKARLMREDYCDGLGDCLPVGLRCQGLKAHLPVARLMEGDRDLRRVVLRGVLSVKLVVDVQGDARRAAG